MLAGFGGQAAERRAAGDVGARRRRPHPGAEAALHGPGFATGLRAWVTCMPGAEGGAVGTWGVVSGRGGEAGVVGARCRRPASTGRRCSCRPGRSTGSDERASPRSSDERQSDGTLVLSDRVFIACLSGSELFVCDSGGGELERSRSSSKEGGSIRRPARIRPARCFFRALRRPTPATASEPLGRVLRRVPRLPVALPLRSVACCRAAAWPHRFRRRLKARCVGARRPAERRAADRRRGVLRRGRLARRRRRSGSPRRRPGRPRRSPGRPARRSRRPRPLVRRCRRARRSPTARRHRRGGGGGRDPGRAPQPWPTPRLTRLGDRFDAGREVRRRGACFGQRDVGGEADLDLQLVEAVDAEQLVQVARAPPRGSAAPWRGASRAGGLLRARPCSSK